MQVTVINVLNNDILEIYKDIPLNLNRNDVIIIKDIPYIIGLSVINLEVNQMGVYVDKLLKPICKYALLEQNK